MHALSNVSREELLAILRSDFPAFVRKCFEELLPGEPFLENWHQEAMAHVLEAARLGNIQRLIVSLPPRYMKSIMISVAFVAFLLGHDPSMRIIVASYGSDLAIKLSNDCRRIMMSPWYRTLFPNTRIAAKNTEFEFTTTKGGFRLATSVGGVLTGRGANFIIVDDAMKAVDATSEAKRRSVNEWYSTALVTRLDDKQNGVIILAGQRLHLDDLTGHVLRSGARWHQLSLPAIAIEDSEIQLDLHRKHYRKSGDVLHPEREPLRALEELRKELGTDAFEAQYQQSPVPPGGAMIKRVWVQRYTRAPERGCNSTLLLSFDTASKDGAHNDFSVCTVWQGEDNKRFFLLEVVRERLNYPSLKAMARRMAIKYDAGTILIEDTGVGTGLIAELNDEGFFVYAVTTERDKISRMSMQSVAFENGQVFLPQQALWLADYEAELFSFPGSRYDDQIDSTSQALAHFRQRGYDSSLNWVC